MITKQLATRIQAVGQHCLADSQCRQWHQGSQAAHEAIRRMATEGERSLTDETLLSFLYDRHALPGNFGKTWSHGKPTPLYAPFSTVRGEFGKMLVKVAERVNITEGEYSAYRQALSRVGVTPAVVNRFVAACFPSQLSEVVVDAQMREIYRYAARDNEIPRDAIARTWFSQNEAVLGWIREAIPEVDDDWMGIVAWCLLDVYRRTNP